MREKKSRQHHVWKHHLRAWETDGKLWCKQGSKIFLSSPTNLAVESEYYRLHKLDEREKKAVRLLCTTGRSQLHAELAEKMLDHLDHPYDILDRIRAFFP